MKEIEFSKLPLLSKKQFVSFLLKNQVNFEHLRSSKFVKTYIRITNKNGSKSPKKVVLRPEDLDRICNKNGRVS